MGKQRVFLENHAHDRFACEEPTLYHILKMRKQESGMVQGTPIRHRKTLRPLTEFMRHKYDTIRMDESVQLMAEVGKKTLPPDSKDSLDAPITLAELQLAVKKGQPRKSPGSDGICHDLFKATWETTKHDILEILN